MKIINCLVITTLFLSSCVTPDEENLNTQCTYDNISGEYMFFSDTDTSSHNIRIIGNIDTFTSDGIKGYNFWFPAAPLSGTLNGCEIIVDSYNDVKRPGLPTPGGSKRWYYESMSGHGEFYPEEDSIVLFINYKRTGDFTENFSGKIYLRKID